jgi:hypothetical protein
MKTHSAAMAGAVLTTILLGSSALARDHSALNGIWTLVSASSDFAGQPVVQTGTVTISERQGIIIVARSFKYEGAMETFFYNDVPTPKTTPRLRPAKTSGASPAWTTTC